MTDLALSSPRPRTVSASSLLRSTLRAGTPLSSASESFFSALNSFGSVFLSLDAFWSRRSTCPKSASTSSSEITSMSRRGSTEPSTWMMFSSSKQRTTWTMASHSRMLAKNWLPRPSPLEAPATRPAMSTNESEVGTTFFDAEISPSFSSLSSGTATTPTFGSIVQKGKLAACAWLSFMSALNRVLLPTFGSPTMPVLSAILTAVLRKVRKGIRNLMGALCSDVARAAAARNIMLVAARIQASQSLPARGRQETAAAKLDEEVREH
mmetsp:Transcript_22510/g.47371  ORF Transcript_22510/g.47371 Transcript_22510/m.47371 type:complete len:266 (-) Transcript_22510:135-932(-)